MKKTLRQAAALRKVIEADIEVRLVGLAASGSIQVSVDSDVETTEQLEARLREARASFVLDVDKVERLNGILHGLRESIRRANSHPSTMVDGTLMSVDAILAAMASADRLLKVVRVLAAFTVNKPAEDIRRLERMRRAQESVEMRSYGRELSVTVSIASQELVEGAKDQVLVLERRKRELEDARLVANTQSTIEIADDDVEFLRGLRLI